MRGRSMGWAVDPPDETNASQAEGAGQATIELEELERHPPRPAIAPGFTLFSLAGDVAGSGLGTPAEWIVAARHELEPDDLKVLTPLRAGPGAFVPGCLLPRREDRHGHDAVGSELERIASLPVETLLDDIAFALGSTPPPHWAAVARRPRWWLVHYARALERIWRSQRETWAAADTLFERELERVETAVARGASPELLAGVHHRSEIRDGAWRFAHPESVDLNLVEEPGFAPVLSGPGSARVRYDHDGRLNTIVYPLPGATRLLDGDLLPPSAALEALLGAQRAAILRFLDRPRTAGHVADALRATPSAMTHHLRSLETAGLVVRERSGRSVIVHRSARGSALVGLYGD